MTFSCYRSIFVLLVHLCVSRIGLLISHSQNLLLAIRSGIDIGFFNADCEVRFPTTTSQKSNCTLHFCSLDIRFALSLLMVLVCDDTELNQGPRKHDNCYNLSIYYWNLNSIANHNFEKVNLLEAYNTVNKVDKVCL